MISDEELKSKAEKIARTSHVSLHEAIEHVFYWLVTVRDQSFKEGREAQMNLNYDLVKPQAEEIKRLAREEGIKEASALSKAMKFDCYGLCAKEILSLLPPSSEKGKE